MNRLTGKLFLLLLPLAISLMLFGYGFYIAKKTIVEDHIMQASHLAVSQSANEMSHFAERRLAEFDQISQGLSLCRHDKLTASNMVSALSFTSGFSALMLTDLEGHITQFTLSANASNKYVLRQSITGHKILSEHTQNFLGISYRNWQIEKPERARKEMEIMARIRALHARGEENSFASRNLTQQLVKLRSVNNLPKTVVTIAEEKEVAPLGLIFDSSTYFFSRPLLDCQGHLVAYYIAVLDRTLMEDLLYLIKKTFNDGGLMEVDVAIARNEDMRLLTETRYLQQHELEQYGLNPNDTPTFRDDLGGLLTNRSINLDKYFMTTLAAEIRAGLMPSKIGISLIVFITERELSRNNQTILQEVLGYELIALLLFLLLTLYIARYIATPISALRKRVRALARGRQPDMTPINRDDEIGELFDAFNQMAATIRSKEEQLTLIANLDSLTGIYNRRAVIDAAHKNRPTTKAVVVCMMDLDLFKQVNDQYGHAVGDAVLKDFALIVQSEIRGNDIFGRLGGEEFTLLLPDTTLEAGKGISERIRAAVEEKLVRNLPDHKMEAITVSIGVTCWQQGDFLNAISVADKYLYQAKDNGRNCIVAGKE